jgi:hypothetical protein
MSEDLPDTQVGPADQERSTQTNLERLQSYLKPDSLAQALLSVWMNGDLEGRQARLHQVVGERFTIYKSDDDAAA